MIITESEKDSLRNFMRVESPLTSYARSLRNDASSQAVESDVTKTGDDKTYDLLAGADVDNLPQDFLDKIKKAQADLEKFQKDTKEHTTEKDKLTKQARDNQARADRNYELLRKHNLVDSQGNASTTSTTDANELAILQNLEAKLVAKGFSPEVAKAQATVQYEAFKVFQPETLKQVGTALSPALSTIGNLNTLQLLGEAKQSETLAPYFAITEIDKEVNESLAIMAQNGSTVTSDTIERLVDMAYGKYERTQTPEKKKETREAIVNFNTKGTTVAGGGNNPNPPSFRVTGQVPVAANSDTATAMAATMERMTKGMNLKKGKK